MEKYRNFSPDFIRGISTLLIIYFHYHCAITRIVSSDLVSSKHYMYAGTLGVSLFFILSGAALSLHIKENISTLSFYRNRIRAIFPIFWITYMIVAFVEVTFFSPAHFSGKNPLLFLLTIFGLDGFLLYKIPNYYLIGEWFLGSIIMIYALYPAIRYLFLRNKYLTLLLSFTVCIALQQTYPFDMALMRFPLTRIFEFTFGMYWMTTFYNRSNKTNFTFLLISIFGIWAIMSFKYSNILISNAAFGIFSFILLISSADLFAKIISKLLFTFLSKFSYAAFLLHHFTIVKTVTCLNKVSAFENYNYIIQVFTLLLIFMLSVLTYHFTNYTVKFLQRIFEHHAYAGAK